MVYTRFEDVRAFLYFNYERFCRTAHSLTHKYMEFHSPLEQKVNTAWPLWEGPGKMKDIPPKRPRAHRSGKPAVYPLWRTLLCYIWPCTQNASRWASGLWPYAWPTRWSSQSPTRELYNQAECTAKWYSIWKCNTVAVERFSNEVLL